MNTCEWAIQGRLVHCYHTGLDSWPPSSQPKPSNLGQGRLLFKISMPGIVAWGFVSLSVHDCFRFSYQPDHFAESVFREGAWSTHGKSDHSCLSGRGQRSHKPPCRLLSLASPHLNMFAFIVLVTSDFWSRVSPASKTRARCLWDPTVGKSELLFCRCFTCWWVYSIGRWDERQNKINKQILEYIAYLLLSWRLGYVLSCPLREDVFFHSKV